MGFYFYRFEYFFHIRKYLIIMVEVTKAATAEETPKEEVKGTEEKVEKEVIAEKTAEAETPKAASSEETSKDDVKSTSENVEASKEEEKKVEDKPTETPKEAALEKKAETSSEKAEEKKVETNGQSEGEATKRKAEEEKPADSVPEKV